MERRGPKARKIEHEVEEENPPPPSTSDDTTDTVHDPLNIPLPEGDKVGREQRKRHAPAPDVAPPKKPAPSLVTEPDETETYEMSVDEALTLQVENLSIDRSGRDHRLEGATPRQQLEVLVSRERSGYLIAQATFLVPSSESVPSDSGEGVPGDSGKGVPGLSGEGVPGGSGEGVPSDGDKGVSGDGDKGVSGESVKGVSSDNVKGVLSEGGKGVPGGSGEGVPGGSGEGVSGGSGEGVPGGSGEGVPCGSGEGVPCGSGEGVPGGSGEGIPGGSGEGIPGGSGEGIPGGSAEGVPSGSGVGVPGGSGKGVSGGRGQDVPSIDFGEGVPLITIYATEERYANIIAKYNDTVSNIQQQLTSYRNILQAIPELIKNTRHGYLILFFCRENTPELESACSLGCFDLECTLEDLPKYMAHLVKHVRECTTLAEKIMQIYSADNTVPRSILLTEEVCRLLQKLEVSLEFASRFIERCDREALKYDELRLALDLRFPGVGNV